jgi:hypothetical protein
MKNNINYNINNNINKKINDNKNYNVLEHYHCHNHLCYNFYVIPFVKNLCYHFVFIFISYFRQNL